MDFVHKTANSVFVEGHVAQMWNPLYLDLLSMYSRLKDLGLVYIDGEVIYPEEASHV